MGNANEVFDNWPNKYNYCNAQYTPLYLEGDNVRVVPESLELEDHNEEDMEED